MSCLLKEIYQRVKQLLSTQDVCWARENMVKRALIACGRVPACKKSLGTPVERHPRGHFTMFHPLEGHLQRHFMFSSLWGNLIKYFTIIQQKKRNPREYFTTFCPLEGPPRRRFIVFFVQYRHLRGHFRGVFSNIWAWRGCL